MSSQPLVTMAVKYDRGKPPLGIIPAVALAECAYALGVGVSKYSKHNYINSGGLAYSRLADAALRHIFKFLGGVDFDEDHPELHSLGCAMAELSMLIHLIDENKGIDDRLEYKREIFGVIDLLRETNLKEQGNGYD